MKYPIIIIGSGLSGYQLAREFRKLDTKTPLHIITADTGDFYPKPQISNAFAKKHTPETLINHSADIMATQLNATVTTQSVVTKIDPVNKIIFCQDKFFPFSKLVLAWGAQAIKPPIMGTAAEDILSINHLHDYVHFRKQIVDKKRIAILGAGLIGCEFSNDLIHAGFDVHVIAPAKAPLDLLIPESIGKLLQNALEKCGIHFHLNCLAHRVDKSDNQFILTLSNSEILETDLILSAIGLIPRIELAKEAHLRVNRGIVVNRFLQTSHPDIYALGDCAEVDGHVLPFITPILQTSRALALTLSGKETAVHYPAMPITVKTPAFPLVICPPPKNCQGDWNITIQNNSVRALFYDETKQLRGFILANEFISERAQWTKEIPALI